MRTGLPLCRLSMDSRHAVAASPGDNQRSSPRHDDDQALHLFQPQPGLARPLIDLDPWCASRHELPSPAVDE